MIIDYFNLQLRIISNTQIRDKDAQAGDWQAVEKYLH